MVPKKTKVAFDVDDTLIIPRVATGLDYEVPNYDTIGLYKWFQSQGCHMIVWSGSGVDWAKTWADKLGLEPDEIMPKQKHMTCEFNCHLSSMKDPCAKCAPLVDIAFDDCDVDLAKVNVKVSRIKNSVSRAEWNKTKR